MVDVSGPHNPSLVSKEYGEMTYNGSFHFLDKSFAEPNHYVYSQASGSIYRGYLRVLKYLLSIIITARSPYI